MKHMKKTISLLLAVLMTLSVFSVVGFAEDGTDPETGTFTVTFYDRAQDTSSHDAPTAFETLTVQAGENAQDPFAGLDNAEIRALNKLTYPEDYEKSFYIWAFTGWSESLENVQKDLRVFPMFEQVGKLYKITYHDFDGSIAEGLNSEYCVYGMLPKESSTPTRPEDARYFYDFKCWSLKKDIDPTANEDDKKYMLNWEDGLSLPNDEKLNQVEGQPGYIDLYTMKNDGTNRYVPVDVYAYYTRHNKEYTLSLTVLDSYGTPVNGASVQVLGASGHLLDQTYAARDEEGNLIGGYKAATGETNDKGQITMYLPYQTEYTIQVTKKDTDEGFIKKVSVSDLKQGVTVTVTSTTGYNEEHKPRCTCVCHSFIGGLWITALNVMHYLFKVKYVCCYDMYATHGDKLAYAA